MEYLLDSFGAKSHNFDAMLEFIDKQMLDTDRELEDCIRDIYRCELAEVNVPDLQKASPADVTNAFLNSHALEKGCCTKTDKIAALFQQLIALLESKPGIEDDILAYILEQTATEGLALRFQCSVPKDVSQSVLSLNAVVDHAEQDHEDVWFSLCHRLSKRYVRRLDDCFMSAKDTFTDTQMKERLQCLHNLSALHPAEEVLKICRNTTQKLLSSLNVSWRNDSNSHSTSYRSKGKAAATVSSFGQAVERFDVFVSNTSKLIEEDMMLLVKGVYGDFTSGVQIIKELYLDHLSADVASLLDMFEAEINGAFSNGKLSKMSKSVSEGSVPKASQLSTKFRGSNNAIGVEVDIRASNVTNSCVESLIKLLSSIERMDGVLHSLCVQFVGLREVKVRTTGRPRRSLKSALKRSSDDLMASKRSTAVGSATADSPPLADRRDTVENIPASVAEANANGRITDLLKWEWGKEFLHCSALVTQAIGIYVTQSWRSMQPDFEVELADPASNSVVLASNSDLRGVCHHKPKKVVRCIDRYVQLLADLTIIAKAGHEGPLVAAKSAFLNSFVDCQEKLLETFDQHLQKRMSAMSLYVLLSSAVHVEESLQRVGQLLDNSDIQAFAALTEKWTLLVSSLKTKIVDKHKMLMCTSILCDSESHHWSGDKEFYEGERCSYSVQMWHMHLSGLHYDLGQVCPPNIARTIFISVLRDSLVVMAMRYADACPTYRRTPQFRADITTILLCTAEHLLAGYCQSIDQLTDPSPSDSDVFVVHSCCSSLLATLAVVTSPLDELCRVFKRGFAKRQSSGSSQPGGGDKSTSGQITLWLSTVWSNIVPRSHVSYAQLQTECALYLQLKILNSRQNEYDPEKLLLTLLMKNLALPMMLCSQLASDWSEDDSGNSEMGGAYFQVFTAFVTVLCRSEVSLSALALSLMPAFKRSETLQWFEMDAGTSSKFKLIPPWISAILEEMSLYCLSIVESSVRRMMQYTQKRRANIAHSLHCDIQLPCGCKVNSSSTQAEDIVSECLEDIISELPGWVLSLPATLVVLCQHVEEYFHSTNAWPHPPGMVALKLIAASVERLLSNSAMLRDMLLLDNLTEEASSMLKLLAQCIISLLSASPTDSSLLPSVAGNFVRRNRGWIKKQLQDTADCFKAAIDHGDINDDLFDDKSAEFLSSKMTTCLQQLLADLRGREALFLLHEFVTNSSRWINDHLDVHLPLPISPADAAARQLHLRLPPYQQPVAKLQHCFNPLHCATHIGQCFFDHEALMTFQFTWPELLRADLGLTEIGFRRLLFNRHEMLEDAALDDNEKKLVDTLKISYNAG